MKATLVAVTKAAVGAATQAALVAALTVAPCGAAQAAPTPAPPAPSSLFAPPTPRGLTRVFGTARPFVSLVNTGGGLIADLTLEHRFEAPLRVSVAVAPLALAADADSLGAITHLRLGAAWTSDYLELGLSAGGRAANFGPGGFSLASHLRLGALDGLRAELSLGYVLARRALTGEVGIGFSHVSALFEVPVRPGLHLFLDGALSFDVWLYGQVGLRHYLDGQRGRGAWIVSGAFGFAWVMDRFRCRWAARAPCADDAAWALGPTVGFGVERRF
jgi:hypothetical protein